MDGVLRLLGSVFLTLIIMFIPAMFTMSVIFWGVEARVVFGTLVFIEFIISVIAILDY